MHGEQGAVQDRLDLEVFTLGLQIGFSHFTV